MQRCPLRSCTPGSSIDTWISAKQFTEVKSVSMMFGLRLDVDDLVHVFEEILVKSLPGKVTERKGSIFYTVQLPGGRGCGGHPHRVKKNQAVGNYLDVHFLH